MILGVDERRYKSFWFEHRTELPLHYKSFVAEVGSQKAASSNVETVFSGVGGMVAKASSIGPDLVMDYTGEGWSAGALTADACWVTWCDAM